MIRKEARKALANTGSDKIRGLRAYLLRRNLIGFGFIFLLIFASLAVFLRTNIFVQAGKQLNAVTVKDRSLAELEKEYRSTSELWNHYSHGDNTGSAGFSGPMGSSTNAFVCKGGIILEILHGDEEITKDILAELTMADALSGDGIQNRRVNGGLGIYAVTAVRDYLREGAYLVYYLDLTLVMHFFNTTFVTIIIIYMLSILLAFLMSQRTTNLIATKVDTLAGYLDEIGKGEFDVPAPRFSICEFDALSLSVQKMAKNLQEASLYQKTFFQNVSHELRTPLMSIRCYAEGIAYGVMEPKASSETILGETDKLSTLVEDILYLSRVRNQIETRKEWLDLRDLFSSSAASFQRPALEQGIELDFRFSEEEILYYCQAEDITRLCSNLLSNALRYAHSLIILECFKEGKRICLSVTDDGDGISEEELPHIFERFYKGEKGVHGIGLSIVRSVANRYDAQIKVVNQSGARFEIWF